MRKSNPLSEYCQKGEKKESVEMSIKGCTRLIARNSVLLQINRTKEQVNFFTMSNSLIKSVDLAKKEKESDAGQLKKEEIHKIEEGDEDDWEDVTDVSIEEGEDDKFSLNDRKKMSQHPKAGELFLVFVLHNEHVKIQLRFHDIEQTQIN